LLSQHHDRVKVGTMLALDPRVVDAVWTASLQASDSKHDDRERDGGDRCAMERRSWTQDWRCTVSVIAI
jgi:hypothetical protein